MNSMFVNYTSYALSLFFIISELLHMLWPVCLKVSMSYFGRFLQENPECVAQGVTLAQFSFQIPRPLRQDYVKKKPKLINPSDEASTIMSKSFQPEEGP